MNKMLTRRSRPPASSRNHLFRTHVRFEVTNGEEPGLLGHTTRHKNKDAWNMEHTENNLNRGKDLLEKHVLR